jgi:phage baseplate assembly protein gpV
VRDHDEESFADGTPLPPPEEPPGGPGKGPSQAQLLMAMAEDTYRLIRSADGRAYAVPKMGPQIAVPLASRSGNSIRARLAASLHRQTGKVASASALADCITVLDGEASELDPRPVWLRVGEDGGTVVVDMGTETGQCITITPHGWTVQADSPVIFRRSELTHPLVQPQRGGTLDAVRELINLPDEDYRLAIGWVVAAYLTGIPHPILLVQGEQGTAKSNLIRTLLALVDPQPAADRTPPKDNREWAIFARASWAFSYDNITDIPPWLSNALCKGVTGDAVLQRVLHSDDDIGVYSFQRVIALTTIAIRHEVAGDLADRILLVEPEVIEKRRTETEITAARAAALPGALGAILNLVAGVLAELPGTVVDNAPRMADFAKVLAALDQVTGWATLASYRAKVATLALSLIEGNTFAYAIYRLATAPSPGGLDPAPWEGTAAELLDTLRRVCAEARMPTADLPEDVRAVGRQVREIAPSLRKAGIDVRASRTGKRRALRIRKFDGPGQEPPGPLPEEEEKTCH